jgi:serine/threonine-protein kinase SRPK3
MTVLKIASTENAAEAPMEEDTDKPKAEEEAMKIDAPKPETQKSSVVVVKDIDIADHDTYECKIADFGNACWINHHFTSYIQTRQYRAPEGMLTYRYDNLPPVILGAKYNESVDMWSMGCMVFELATGDLLFEPKSGKSFDKEDGKTLLIPI